MATAVENFRNLSLFDNYTNYGESKSDSNLMYREAERLKSYGNWPLDFIEPKCLAKAGFYYTSRNDLVRCAFCKIEIMKWQKGDNVMTEHRRWSENCPLVCGVYCGNIPIDDSTSFSSQSTDKKKYYGIEIRPNSFPEWGTINLNSKLNFRKCSQSKQGPRYPEYNSLENRLKSFTEWPPSINQKPEQLAGAGFYYNGKGDQTVCFDCGLGLRDWADDDDPWEQHAKWSSKCNFLRSQKGAEYTSEVSNRQKPVLTPEEVIDLHIPYNKTSSSKTASNDRFSTSVTCKSKDIQTKDVTAKQQSSNSCKLCNLKEKSILFLPCRHIVVCEDCAPCLTTCIACSKSLEATVKVAVSIS